MIWEWLIVLAIFTYLLVKTWPIDVAERVTPKTVRYRGVLYVFDTDTRACTLWQEWMDERGYQRQQKMGLILPLDKCPKPVLYKLENCK